jgi:uncharacterized membrane protein
MVRQPFAIPAVVIFISSIPMALGMVPRNRLYGFRTKRALADDATWFRVNRFAGIAIMIASVMYFTITISKPYDGDFRIWLVHLTAFVVPLAAALAITAAYAKRS